MTLRFTLFRVFYIIYTDKHLNENNRIYSGVLSQSPDKSFHHISFCQRENAWHYDRRNWTQFLFLKHHYQYFFVTNPILVTVNIGYVGMVNFSNKNPQYPPSKKSYGIFAKRVSVWRLKMMLNNTAYPKKYAHGFVVLCFVVVMQSFIMNSHEVFIHIHQGCFAGTGAIVRLPQCQWSKPDGYGKIRQCITTTKHSKAKIMCIFLGIYCTFNPGNVNIMSCFKLNTSKVICK